MKADEPRQNRIPFMLSDAELTAVDDWRFSNRIGTRAEAIRRLCQVGLALDVQGAKEGSQLLMQASNELILPLLTLETLIEEAELDPVDDILITDAIDDVEQKIKGVQSLLGRTIHIFWSQLRSFTDALKDEDLQEALADLDQLVVPEQAAEGNEK